MNTRKEISHMRMNVNGKCFDTETATKIIHTHYGYVGEILYYDDTLYKTNDGEYFLHRSRFVFPAPIQSFTRETVRAEIIPMTLDEAKNWCRKYFGDYVCDDIFETVA